MSWKDLLRMSLSPLKTQAPDFPDGSGVLIGTASIVVMISWTWPQQSLYREVEQSGGLTCDSRERADAGSSYDVFEASEEVENI